MSLSFPAAVLAALLHLLPMAEVAAAGPVAAGPPVAHDDSGRRVVLPAPARRIVTLAPHAAELVIAAGAAESLVGVSEGPPLPQTPAGLPRVGGPGAVARERLLMLRPDLVIAWASGNRPADLAWLEQVGIPVFRSEPRDLAAVAANLRAIGRLAGTTPTAEGAARAFERDIRTPCAGMPPRDAYLVIWPQPVMTVGGRHWLNDVLDRAGYRNVFATVDRGVFTVGAETLLLHAAATRIPLLRRFDDSPADVLADLLSRPGPRLAEAVRRLCRQRLDGS